MHDDLFEEARFAIEELFSDTSVDIHRTLDDMRALKEDIEMKIEALEADIRSKL
jgi:hypothetical protein